MEIGGSNMKVTRASIGFTQASGLELGVNAMSMFAGTTSNDFEEGRVLCLLNMVTAEELIDNDEYEGMSTFYPLLANITPWPQSDPQTYNFTFPSSSVS